MPSSYFWPSVASGFDPDDLSAAVRPRSDSARRKVIYLTDVKVPVLVLVRVRASYFQVRYGTSIIELQSVVRGWEGIAEFWYGTSRPNYWLGFSTSRLQKRED